MVEKFDEFLEEVEKDIRQEKLLNLWKQYGKQVTIGIVAVIALIGLYNLWGHYEQNKRVEMAEKLITAQELIAHGDSDKALVILNSLSIESHNTYQPLALFQKAGLLLQGGAKSKPAEAISIYNQLSANKKIEPLWRDLAALLAIMASMDLPNIKAEDLLAKLEPLTVDASPWRYFAREMKGVLLNRKGEGLKAAEIFARLVQDNNTPSGISMRARLMTQIVSTSKDS